MVTQMNTTLHYFGNEMDKNGMPTPYFSYVLNTSTLPVGSLATIVSYSTIQEKLLLHHRAPDGGTEEDAVKIVESYLDRLHPGLNKRRT
jgi:hypothetical protein